MHHCITYMLLALGSFAPHAASLSDEAIVSIIQEDSYPGEPASNVLNVSSATLQEIYLHIAHLCKFYKFHKLASHLLAALLVVEEQLLE